MRRRRFCLSTIVLCVILACVSSPAVAAVDDLPAEGKLISLNGMEMYNEVHGQGEPLVLLHGFSGSSSLWKPQVSDLAKHYQLVIPDLRGHGRSTNPSGKFTHRQSALDVFALLDTLKIQRFRAMGISTGGMTLIHMATSQPERIEAVVLIGATHYFRIAAKSRWELSNTAHINGSGRAQLNGAKQRGAGSGVVFEWGGSVRGRARANVCG
jgi:pimeloyl-ACP methyl ester carboxylesterase